MIQCSQCGSTVLQLTCNPAGNGWDVHCGNGHPYAPVPGYEIKVEVDDGGGRRRSPEDDVILTLSRHRLRVLQELAVLAEVGGSLIRVAVNDEQARLDEVPQGEAAADCTFPGCRASAPQETIHYDIGLDGGRCERHKGMLGVPAGIPDGQA